jgi:DNA-binding NtrC family response regulator
MKSDQGAAESHILLMVSKLFEVKLFNTQFLPAPGVQKPSSDAALRPLMAKIFVVEDDLATQRLLEVMLKTQQHDVIGFAISAAEAKAAITALTPDICLIDINIISSESGIDVAAYVIERLGYPVVLMSSDDHPTLPVPFILKPIRSFRLFSVVNRVLEDQKQ